MTLKKAFKNKWLQLYAKRVALNIWLLLLILYRYLKRVIDCHQKFGGRNILFESNQNISEQFYMITQLFHFQLLISNNMTLDWLNASRTDTGKR